MSKRDEFFQKMLEADSAFQGMTDVDKYQSMAQFSILEDRLRRMVDKMKSVKQEGDRDRKTMLQKELAFRDCLFESSAPSMPEDFGVNSIQEYSDELRKYALSRIGFAAIMHEKDFRELQNLWNAHGSDDILEIEWDGPGTYDIIPVEEYHQRSQRTFYIRKFKKQALKATMET